MKRNKQDNGIEVKKAQLQAYQQIAGTLRGRLDLANRMGTSFEGQRDLYKSLGYPREIAYEDYYAQYLRQDAAGAIINRPISATWRGRLQLLESDDDQDTPLEKEWKTLEKNLKLKDKFIRLDKLANIGEYAVLLFGFSDVKGAEDWAVPVQKGGNLKLLYTKPFAQDHAGIASWENDPKSPRYGMPKIYELTFQNPGKNKEAFQVRVHHTRILHVTVELLEDEVYGVPSLKRVFNRLKDLEKLVGGSAEMFWRGARPGYGANVKEGYRMGEEEEEQLDQQISEYEHHLRRILKLEGVELEALATQVSDPTGHLDIQIQMISMITGIPKRILVGSERGELASSQDQDAWKEIIQVRREEYAEVKIIRPFVERCIDYGILSPYEDEFAVDWVDLFVVSGKDKAEMARTRAQALKDYVSQPAAEAIVPPDAFLQYLLGLDEDQVNMIIEMRDALRREEEEFDETGDEIEREIGTEE